MMRFTVEICGDNSAFWDGSDELGRIFRELADDHSAIYLRESEDGSHSIWGKIIRDRNGNRVGEFKSEQV